MRDSVTAAASRSRPWSRSCVFGIGEKHRRGCRGSMRRRAYVDSHVPKQDAARAALTWAGRNATRHVPDTGTVDDNL
jgi:hypothetical protein